LSFLGIIYNLGMEIIQHEASTVYVSPHLLFKTIKIDELNGYFNTDLSNTLVWKGIAMNIRIQSVSQNFLKNAHLTSV
jgi:hypothetical protein